METNAITDYQVPATPENLNEVHVTADTDTIEMLAGVFELLGLPLLPSLDEIPDEFVLHYRLFFVYRAARKSFRHIMQSDAYSCRHTAGY